MRTNLQMLFVFFVVLALTATVKGEQPVKQSVVDTVKSMALLQKQIDAENAQALQEIEILKKEIQELSTSEAKCTDIMSETRSLLDNIKSSGKSEIVNNSALEYFNQRFDRIPVENVLTYCNEKDVRKAKEHKDSEGRVSALVSKFKEKEGKRIAKGDYSSGFLPSLMRQELTRLEATDAEMRRDIDAKRTELKEKESKLKKLSSKFSLSLWREMKGEVMPPLHSIEVEVAITGIDTLSYAGLVKRYFPTSDKRAYCDKSLTVEGCFDGLQRDRLTLFPYPFSYNSEESGQEYGSDAVAAFDAILLMSEKGTLLPQLFSLPDEIFVLDSTEDEFSTNFRVERLPSVQGADMIERDGIALTVNDRYIDGVHILTMVYEDGRWKTQPVKDAKFTDFSECVEILRGKDFRPDIERMKASDLIEGINYDLDVLMVDNEQLGFGDTTGEKMIYFKTDASFIDLELPAKDFSNWFTMPHPWGTPNQEVLVVTYENDGTNGEKAYGRREFYSLNPVSDCYQTVNGKDMKCAYWEKVAIATKDLSTGKYKSKRISE